jgi:hypothetical protein
VKRVCLACVLPLPAVFVNAEMNKPVLRYQTRPNGQLFVLTIAAAFEAFLPQTPPPVSIEFQWPENHPRAVTPVHLLLAIQQPLLQLPPPLPQPVQQQQHSYSDFA